MYVYGLAYMNIGVQLQPHSISRLYSACLWVYNVILLYDLGSWWPELCLIMATILLGTIVL